MRFITRASSRALHHGRRHRRGDVHRPAGRHRDRRRRTSTSTPTTPTPGATAVLTFRVPDESEKGALTTQLSVELPNVASASTEVMPGWTARLDRDAAAGTVRSVTWTAAPGTGISPDQFALFRISVKLPERRDRQLPRHADLLRRHGRALGSADAARRRRARIPCTGADLDGPDAEPPTTIPSRGRAVVDDRQLGPLARRRRAGGRRASRSQPRCWRGGGHETPCRRGGSDRRARGGGARRRPGVAAAHATRIATDPAENAELTEAPPRVSATFNEAMQPQFAAMTVVGPDGNLWSTGDPQVRRRRHQRRSAAARPGRHLHGELPGDVGGRACRVRLVVVPADRGGHGHPGPVGRAAARTSSDPRTAIPVWPFYVGAVRDRRRRRRCGRCDAGRDSAYGRWPAGRWSWRPRRWRRGRWRTRRVR